METLWLRIDLKVTSYIKGELRQSGDEAATEGAICETGIRTSTYNIQLVKGPDLQYTDRWFELHCPQGAFLVWEFSKPLIPNR